MKFKWDAWTLLFSELEELPGQACVLFIILTYDLSDSLISFTLDHFSFIKKNRAWMLMWGFIYYSPNHGMYILWIFLNKPILLFFNGHLIFQIISRFQGFYWCCSSISLELTVFICSKNTENLYFWHRCTP